ncbi:hypothetical protein [Wolbachia endosymbiont of Cantharis cryptica]|uniref:hypothetical protein n=1 Tax=Wolbachia endosymbiont of Cantharis cryptica TaxID=3066132 RepID=UPI00376EF77B
MKNKAFVIFLSIVALAVLLLILVLMYFFKWKKEGSKMLPDKSDGASSANMESVEHIDRKDKEIPTAPFNSQKEQEENDLTVINHMTLEDTLRVLKSDSLLSDLDNDLKNVKEGRNTIQDHKEYFQTQVDKKLKQLSLVYSPNSSEWSDIPEKERPKAQAIQAKLNDMRSILKYFNENFSQEHDFKYSYFSKVRVDLLGNEKTLESTTYAVLNELGKLSYIEYNRLVPSLNEFLKSSQASIKGFILNDEDLFQKEKNNAECYFQIYLIGHEELLANLESFCDLCKEDDHIKPIATQMLNECKTQSKILNKVNGFLNQSQLNFDILNCQYPYCVNDKQNYEQADKDFTLPFIEYINILAICNEIINGSKVPLWKKCVNTFNRFINNKYEIVAGHEVIRNLGDLLSLHKFCHRLLTYYCYGNKENEKLAAELLNINSFGKEHTLRLLVQVVNVYSNYLEKEFQPEKSFYEKIAEVQMKFLGTIKGLCDEFCKKLSQHHEQFLETESELHKTELELHETKLEIYEQVYKQDSEFYKQTSEFLIRRLERRKANIAQMDETLNKKVSEGVMEEQQNKPSCSSSSQQQPANQADDQPGPSSKLGEVPPILRSQSLNPLHSDDKDISRPQCS